MADGDPRGDDELLRSTRSDPDAFARRLLGHALRRGVVEDRARRRLGMRPLTLTDEALERVEAIASADATARSLQVAFDALPPDQRAAIEARVLEEREYEEIARSARTSPAVIRRQVSRGLAGLRVGVRMR